ncbi:nitroreductase family protein [Streptococcus massiliensis]|uniref:Nitroreductase family protein n=1 Tax=Streptococcus massiliensis TaxID=313439 RepID=A0A380KYQ4_9STRE|nr:nitroreductase family protein [Streptococcus massiliensis]SUN76701.1 nitroreductase family protein [Streptococcus massiliensis]
MTETIDLMRQHRSIRRFTDKEISEEDLKNMINAGRAASSWKNFQSYSIIVVRSNEKKAALFDLVPQEAIRQSSVFLLFVGDLNRAQKGVALHTDEFYPEGTENLLISSVDAALAAQNTLLAAESLGYAGVIIGLVRYASKGIGQLFDLPAYTYPIFGMALGQAAEEHAVKPRLPYEAVVFDEMYQEQDETVIKAYDQVQADYAGDRALATWSERLAQQFGAPANPASSDYLQEKKLL